MVPHPQAWRYSSWFCSVATSWRHNNMEVGPCAIGIPDKPCSRARRDLERLAGKGLGIADSESQRPSPAPSFVHADGIALVFNHRAAKTLRRLARQRLGSPGLWMPNARESPLHNATQALQPQQPTHEGRNVHETSTDILQAKHGMRSRPSLPTDTEGVPVAVDRWQMKALNAISKGPVSACAPPPISCGSRRRCR